MRSDSLGTGGNSAALFLSVHAGGKSVWSQIPSRKLSMFFFPPLLLGAALDTRARISVSKVAETFSVNFCTSVDFWIYKERSFCFGVGGGGGLLTSSTKWAPTKK